MTREFRFAACAAGLLLCLTAQAQDSYSTDFEAPAFVPGDVLGQNGWGHLSNSPTRGAIEALPAGAPAELGAQGLAIRTRNVDFFGVTNHLYSPTIDPPAGEAGATVEGAVAPAPNDYFLATFWYRTPAAPLVSTRADGRFAEFDPSSKGPGADIPANRYAQVRLYNTTNAADGLIRVETSWFAPAFTTAVIANGLTWDTWYRFEYAVRTVDGTDGAAPNDLFTLRIFDSAGNPISSTAPNTCGSTFELGYRSGSFGGSASARGINGFDFWSTTGPNDTLVGYIDGLTFQSLSLPDPAMTIASGDNQQAFVGSPLPAPLTVAIANTPVDQARCYPVTFAVETSPPAATGQSVATTTVAPDAANQAATAATLGDVAGIYTVSASSPALSGSPLIFTAEAIAMQPALGIEKLLTSAPEFIVAGSVLTYTITATNTGNVELSEVVVSDPAITPTSNVCATLAPAATCILSGTYVVDADDVNAGQVSNTATVQSAQLQPLPTTLITPIERADLSIVKDDGGVDFLPGGAIDYVLTVQNLGPDDAQLVEVIDVLPADVQFVSAVGAGWSCANNAGTVTCTRALLAAGAQATIDLSVTVDADFVGDSIVNQASVSNAVADIVPANNSSSVETDAIQAGGPADLVLGKSAGAMQVNTGDTITYTLTVGSVGVTTALGVMLADPTPAGLVFLDATAPCAGGFPCALGDISNGANIVVTARFTVPADYAAATITNTATASSNTPDPTPADNTASVETPVIQTPEPADLVIGKVADAAQVTVGETLTYTLTVANVGETSAIDVTLADPTPAGLVFLDATAPCAAGFPCALGDIANGANVVVTARYTVPVDYVGATITNTATVSTDVVDPTPQNNTASAVTPTVQLPTPADLSLTKLANAAQVDAGDTVTYMLTVGNAGETTAAAVVLDDPTPAGLVFLDASAPCAAGFPCALGDIASGATVIVMARFTVPANYAAVTISNTATVASNVVDPTPADNADTVVTGVVLPPPAPPPVSVIAVPADEPWALLALGFVLFGLGWRARRT
jgi:uncharacterized repeat protein (TIGR01451 family)